MSFLPRCTCGVFPGVCQPTHELAKCTGNTWRTHMELKAAENAQQISKPGVDKSSFHIKLSQDEFVKGDIMIASRVELRVTRVYPFNRWRRFWTWMNGNVFRYLGFGVRVRMCEVKAVPLEYSSIDSINNNATSTT